MNTFCFTSLSSSGATGPWLVFPNTDLSGNFILFVVSWRTTTAEEIFGSKILQQIYTPAYQADASLSDEDLIAMQAVLAREVAQYQT